MRYKIKIWNYRSIPLDSPVELEIKDGITFILGINNVGKSNFLRFFYEFRSIFFVANEPKYSVVRNSYPTIYFDHIVNRKFPEDPIKVKFSFQDKSITYEILPHGSDRHTPNYSVKYYVSTTVKTENDYKAVSNLIDSFKDVLYIGASRIVINQASGAYYDIEIGSNFYQTWSKWAVGGSVEEMEKIRKLVLELKGLFSYNDFEVLVNDQKNNLLVRTDDGTFQLDELGSGITHFIVVLGNALIRNPGFIFIDEPETGLHPKLQQLFIQALASKAKYGLIATSHSVGLARSTADDILSLTKAKNGRVNLQPYGQHFKPTIDQSVTELGYSQYAELGGNNILLVEGRTDIKAFREILRLYGIESEFIILSFGGRQFMTNDQRKIIDELTELKRFNTNVAVIFDSEREKKNVEMKPEFKVFKECCEKLGFKVFSTDYHSTENYIVQKAIDKVLLKKVKALTPFEKFQRQWEKEKNWLLFREMSVEDFASTELHLFIENSLKPLYVGR